MPRIRDAARPAGSLLEASEAPAYLMEMVAAQAKERVHLLVAQWHALPARRLSRRGLTELTDAQLRDIGLSRGGAGRSNAQW